MLTSYPDSIDLPDDGPDDYQYHKYVEEYMWKKRIIHSDIISEKNFLCYITFMKSLCKFLGIDYGTKRIGVAVSDENGTLAFPKAIILNDENTFRKLAEIIKAEDIGEIVIGESVDFSGRLNALSARIEIFIKELKEKFNLPVYKQKEFLTSVEARRYGSPKKLSPSQAHSKVKQIKSGRVDAGAAALILQRYLDKRKSPRHGGAGKNNSGNNGDII